MESTHGHLTKVVCWTRMQAEGGQDIETIIARKELERRAGGMFFWGIGNAPNRSVKKLAANGDDIDVVFSVMKSRPKLRDAAPADVLVWQTYFDFDGNEIDIPSHVLVTSRMETASGVKRVHYALVCSSEDQLRLDDLGPFDPLAYRNISDARGRVGSSQVTALIVRTTDESSVADYRVNFRAKLAGSYWVRLGQPCVIRENTHRMLVTAIASNENVSDAEWIRIVADVRSIAAKNMKSQSTLF